MKRESYGSAVTTPGTEQEILFPALDSQSSVSSSSPLGAEIEVLVGVAWPRSHHISHSASLLLFAVVLTHPSGVRLKPQSLL